MSVNAAHGFQRADHAGTDMPCWIGQVDFNGENPLVYICCRANMGDCALISLVRQGIEGEGDETAFGKVDDFALGYPGRNAQAIDLNDAICCVISRDMLPL